MRTGRMKCPFARAAAASRPETALEIPFALKKAANGTAPPHTIAGGDDMGGKKRRKPKVRLTVTETLAPDIPESEREELFRRFIRYAESVRKR